MYASSVASCLYNESLGSSLFNYCKSQFPFHDLDDNAFKIVLYEFEHGTISYATDQLETLFFNPILDQHFTLSDPNSDLDPDLNNQNYASSASYCNYETAEDLNGVIGGNNLISFWLFHLNACSPQVAQARNMSIGEHRHCYVKFKV